MIDTTISQAFSQLTDPIMERSKRHPLVNVITISVCAIIFGCDDFCSIEEYGKSKIEWFKQFLDLPNGIPSHDTFNDVFNRIKPSEFSEAFTQWVNRLGSLKGDIVALDGKVIRRTLDKANGNPAIHLVSAWSVKNNLCFGQIKVSHKSNEITAIPTITTDAMGCQFSIAEQIVSAKADYVLALKRNQGEFSGTAHSVFKSVNGDHGRIEERNVWMSTEVEWLIERHPRWRALLSWIRAEQYRE